MVIDDGATRLLLRLGPEAGTDAEEVDHLTRRLRAEIAELDVEAVTAATGVASPDGAKSADPVTIGALVVALSASGGVLTTLLGVLNDWLTRRAARHRITVTIDGDSIVLERATQQEQRDLVAAFARRHSGG